MTVDIADAYREAQSVRRGTASELGAMADTLARAFVDDPPMAWVLNDDRRRLRMLERSFRLYLRRIWLPQDHTYTTESTAGVAAWELPGRWKLGVVAQLRLAVPMAAIHGRIVTRVIRAVERLEAGHPHAPHHYLAFIGVDPAWQGRGLGAALMQPVLDRCDREQVGAYLEASTPRSRMLYERNGFEVTEELVLGPGAPPVWRMWRNPA